MKIPDSVTVIGDLAFTGCRKLVDPSGLCIVRNILYACKSDLTNVTIPDSVTIIGGEAFTGCNRLKEVAFSANVTEICDRAFAGCDKLEKVSILATEIKVGHEPFLHCKALKEVPMIDGLFRFHPYEDWDPEKPMNVDRVESYTGELISGRDYAMLCLFQKGKKWEKWLSNARYDSTDFLVDQFCKYLGNEQTASPALCKRITQCLIDNCEHGDFTPKNIGKLYCALQRNNDSAARLLEVHPTISLLLSNSADEDGIDPFIRKDGKIVSTTGSGPLLTLPAHEPISEDALVKAEYSTVVITEDNNSVTAQWLQKVKLSENIKQVSVTWNWLRKKRTEMEGDFSKDLRKILVISTEPEEDEWREYVIMQVKDLKRSFGQFFRAHNIGKHEQISFLLSMLPPIPDDLPETPDGVISLCDLPLVKEIMKTFSQLADFYYPPFNAGFKDSTRNVPEESFFLILHALSGEGWNKAERLFNLIDHETIREPLLSEYKVDSHSRNTKDISFLIPAIARLADVKLASRMLTDYLEMEYRSDNREILSDAICEQLGHNDNREILLMLDKRGYLYLAADVRGISEEELRTLLMDNVDDLLDEAGSFIMDYGPRKIAAVLKPDLSFCFVDQTTGKTTQTLPKVSASDDKQKADLAGSEFKKFKNSVSNIKKIKERKINEMLYGGYSMDAAEWKKDFLTGKIAQRVSTGILWGVYDGQDDLLSPFRVDLSGMALGQDGLTVTIGPDDRIGVVDAAQLSPEALETWRNHFWSDGLKAIVRQFEAPARYVPLNCVAERYKGCSVPVGYAMNVIGYSPYGYGDDYGNTVFSDYCLDIRFRTESEHQDSGELPVQEVHVADELPDFDHMTDHQKRLWNRALIRADSVFKPWKKAAAVVASGDTVQVRIMLDTSLITQDNIQDMINLAIKRKQTEVTALLLDRKYKWMGEMTDPFAELNLDF